jgi:hypothetical protein
MKRLLAYTAVAVLGLGASAASAATLNVNFEGSPSGGVYTENGFTFTSNQGTVSLATCPPTGGCLQINNNEIITVTYVNGAFDVVSFSFRSPGNGGDLTISGSNGTSKTISENLGGNDLDFVSVDGLFDGVVSFSWQNLENGSGRVDNIAFEVIPLPAAGWLLLAGVGGLVAMRRKKAA